MSLPKRWYKMPTNHLNDLLESGTLNTPETEYVLAEIEARDDPSMFPEDTPCIEDGRDNCNDWGTGEGRYHGRI